MPKQTKSSNNAALKGFALTLVILILAVCVMAAMTEGFTNWILTAGSTKSPRWNSSRTAKRPGKNLRRSKRRSPTVSTSCLP